MLDFTVVIIGLIQLLPNVPNLKGLRTMRIFRPLRSINAVPSMKRLASTLLQSIPPLGYLILLLGFFILIVSVLGLQLFNRGLYYRCRFTDAPLLNNETLEWPFDES